MIRLHWFRGPKNPSGQYKDMEDNIWDNFYNENSKWPCVICREICYEGYTTYRFGNHYLACSEHFRAPFDVDFVKKLVEAALAGTLTQDAALFCLQKMITDYEAGEP